MVGGLDCSAPVDVQTEFHLQLPERLSCAAPPQEMLARLWISGMSEACQLSVDSEGGVSGSCPGITARTTRTATLDYYLEEDLSQRFSDLGLDNPYVLILAQARKSLPMTDVDSETFVVNFVEADFVDETSCLDYDHLSDSGELGRARVEDFGEIGSPCDVDGDLANSSGGSNLQELCAAGDPYVFDTP